MERNFKIAYRKRKAFKIKYEEYKSMETFDIVVNFIEAFISFYFIYYLFHKRKGIVPFIIICFIKSNQYNYP